MECLRKANSKKISLDPEDWFCNKAMVQYESPFEMDFLRKVSCKKMFRRKILVKNALR